MKEAILRHRLFWPIGVNSALLPRIAPFILFMSFIGIEEIVRFLTASGVIALSDVSLNYLYPVKALSVALVLFLFRKKYPEIVPGHLLSLRCAAVSVLCGIAVFTLWIHMDMSFNPSGTLKGFNPLLFQDQAIRYFMIAMRLAGAVLVVPVMEELFWRSFLIRYMVDQDFTAVPVGMFTWTSFLVTALLFGLEHNFILAGIMAGIAYNLLLYYTRSITHCILAHAVTNLLLGIYVLATQRWYFW